MCVLIFSLCSGQSSALANLFVFTSSQIEWSSHQAVNGLNWVSYILRRRSVNGPIKTFCEIRTHVNPHHASLIVLPCLSSPCLALPCLALSCLALLLFWRTFFVSSLGYYVFLPTSLLSPTQSLALIPAAFCRAPFEKALRHRRRDVGALMTVAGEVRGGAVRDTTAGAARKRLRNRRCSSGFRYVVMLSFVVPGFLF